MARTKQGRELTEEHRIAQVKLGDALSKVVRSMFRKHVRFDDVDASSTEFVRAVVPEILKFRNASRLFSIDYLREFKDIEAPDAPDVEFVEDDVDPTNVARSLGATVRGVVKAITRKGYAESDAMDRAEAAVVGKATRFVADGGRGAIEQHVRRGLGPVGYARVVDADPCPFCAMLASRGVYYMGEERTVGLYRSDSFRDSDARFAGDGEFKVHDHCQCTLEPVYERGGKIRLPGNGNELAKEWAEIASGRSDAWLAWQRWRESGTLPEDYDGPLDGKRRVSPPTHGQKSGTRKRPEPAKASERAGGIGRPVKTADDLHELADLLQKRANHVQEDIAKAYDAGQDSHDPSLMALEREYENLLSRIARYRTSASKMA